MSARARTFCLFILASTCLTAVARQVGTAPPPVLWSGTDPDFLTGDISPDGRHLSDIDWSSGDLQIVDLQSGQVRGLTGQGYAAGGYAWTSAFSSDGHRIAVAWYRDRLESHELRVIDVGGTGMRVLIEAARDRYYVEPLDWSTSDDEILVAIQGATRTWQLALVAVRDGGMRVVTNLDWQAPGGGHDQAYPHADLSPDGRYVAYDYPHSPTAATRDIFAVAVDGGRRTTIVAGPGSDRLLGWLPDGRSLLFYSDRGGSPAVWRVAVRDGMAAGEPLLIREAVLGLIPLGFTSEGYAYGVGTENEQVHTAIVDPKEGRVVERPVPMLDPVTSKSLAGDWSPDGSRLALVTHAPPPDPRESLVVLSAAGAVEREIVLTPVLHASNGTLRWRSGGRVFLYAYEQGRPGIYEIDLRRQVPRRLPIPEAVGRAALKWFDVSPDGRTVYLAGPPTAGHAAQLLAFDTATAALRVIADTPVIRASLEVSPDGGHLAFLARDSATRATQLQVIPTTRAADVRTVYRATRGTLGPPVAWMPDGSRVLVELQEDGERSRLWMIDVADGGRTPFMDDCCRENDVRIDRSGRRAAFAAGTERGEVRVLKH